MPFLPFLGAAVTARKHRASGAQQAIVALAGPVPGLVLGVVLLWVVGASIGLGIVYAIVAVPSMLLWLSFTTR